MKDEASIYARLAEHLDRLPGGFSSSDSAADLRLLQRLFTLPEAELAVCLTLEPEPSPLIAQRAGLPVGEAQQRLDEMSSKGLIFSTCSEDGTRLYQAVPFVIGIFEFQVNNLNKPLLRDLAYYWRACQGMSASESIPQIRTIPIGASLDPHLEVLPYEQVRALVESAQRFAVAPCICRRTARMTGGGCGAPEESCLVFYEWADFYVRDGRARSIQKAEVYQILVRADQANLVLQPSNSQQASFICCCCGCCCGILGDLKNHPQPSGRVSNAFTAQLDPDLCTGCRVCLQRCQMQALSEADGRVRLNSGRCIGCGLCVSTCSSEALTLVRKAHSAAIQIPATMRDTWRVISRG